MSGELERRQLLAVNPYDFTYICYETDEKDNIYRGAAFTSDDENNSHFSCICVIFHKCFQLFYMK